jgi:hypothetical protein
MHAPARQISRAPQVFPQAPQLAASLLVSAHVAPHRCRGAAHVVVHTLSTHGPSVHWLLQRPQ